MVDTYTVYKTGSPSTTVTVSSNGTFTMPGYAVTVSATFVQNNTLYHIALGTVIHGSISASAQTALSGTSVTLSATPATGYSLYSWYVFKTGDMNTTVGVSGNSFTMPAFDVTVMATFVLGSATGDYVKVTEAPADWSGEYLIVCESQNVAFNGTVDNNWGRCSSVTISNATIGSNATTDGYKVTVSQSRSGYKFMFPDGKYMNWTGEKKFSEGTNAVAYTIALSNGDVSISFGENTLKYNYNSGNGGLRSYKTGQTAIQLYKKTMIAPPTHNIQFHPNGGTGMMDDQSVNEFEPTALMDNAFVREGFVFEGWNTAADGTGDYYADGATVILLDDLELYAQWNQLFTITLAEVSHGSISSSATQAFEDDEIILTATPDPCYALAQWTVTDAQGQAINVTDNHFEMPASNVTVGATLVFSPQSFVHEYHLVTSSDQLVAGRTYLIVNMANGKALGTTQNNNNRSAAEVTINEDIISTINENVCELTLGATGNNWTFFDAHYGNNGGYLYAASSSENYLRTQASVTNNAKWSITIGSGGTATLAAQGSNTHNLLKYNSNNSIFSCYATNNTMQDVCLFRRTEIIDYPAEQAVTLAQGWTWWAPTIDMTLTELETALGGNGILVNSQTSEYASYENGSWSGSLTSIVPGQMYKIQTSASCSLALGGSYITTVAVPILPGYNWFGYAGMQTADITVLFNGFSPVEGDKINSQDEGFAIFENGAWGGSLTTLYPGHGYVYISNATGSKTLVFQ